MLIAAVLLHGGSGAVAHVQGVCFHLYSKARSSGLAEYQLPELQRSPLDELSLQAGIPAARHILPATVDCIHSKPVSSIFHWCLTRRLVSHCLMMLWCLCRPG